MSLFGALKDRFQ